MSRARNIKPGFFKNDRLAECQPLARILFAGLWCEADREGRLEDRPKRLKAECLPYDDCDVHELLTELADGGFIVRYESGGNRYIDIPRFLKHQNPHCKEAASLIPEPDQHGADTSSSTIQAPVENRIDPADSPLPIPNPPTLIPDTKQPQAAPSSEDQLPDWLPIEAWRDWCQYRQKVSKSKFTAKAKELSLRTLISLHEKGHDPLTVINLAIERGWTGLFEPRDGPVSKPAIAQQFSQKTYNGTPDDELPSFFRN